MTVTAVIVAGGRGKRMGADINKVFLPLGGTEILAHTLRAFELCPDIDDIVVVTGEADMERVKKIAERESFKKLSHIVPGGAERSDSVYNGLRAAVGDIAAIHDGARCLIDPSDISAVVRDAEKYGAAALGVTVKDTLKSIDGSGNICGTIDRERTVLIQTPQVFKKDEIKALHERVNNAKRCRDNSAISYKLKEKKDGYAVTDDCSVFERYGRSVHVTKGSYDNIKLTTPEDIAIGEQILRRRKKRKCLL